MPDRPHTTADGSAPVAGDEHSLTVGPDGQIKLQDQYLLEQMTVFTRERIPERQPHAKAGGAFGTFVVTDDVSSHARAAARLTRLLGVVLHERGQPRHRGQAGR